MQSKAALYLKERLRKAAGDSFGVQWSDALLDKIILESQREYVFFTGGLVGEAKLIAGKSPVQSLPDDFFKIIRAFTPDGKTIPITSYRKLADDYGNFLDIKGLKVESLCFNFSDFGKYRTFPAVPEGTVIGTLIYSRVPSEKHLEVKNLYAVEQYALFMMFQLTGKPQAENYYLSFLQQVNKEQSEGIGHGSKHIQRTGVYY
jgi:hypothetical protein